VPHTPYFIAYQIAGDDVEILAVIHAARRWPDRLD
jgi:plasmid stabilization system protein ParE